MVGLEGRASLLVNLSHALKANAPFFGAEGRPGNMIGPSKRQNLLFPHITVVVLTLEADYLESESIADGPSRRAPLAALWHVLVFGLAPIWPKDRTTLGGVPLGDVWPCDALKAHARPRAEGDELVPFHKLTGWTTYSLIEPIEKILGWRFDGLEDMTGLPEYRNGACIAWPASCALWWSLAHTHIIFWGGDIEGGLLVDLGVLSLKPSTIAAEYYPSADSSITRLPPSHPAVIEWRAMTVIEL